MGCGPFQAVCDALGGAAGSVASAGFGVIAKSFGKAAETVCDWMWSAIGSTTTVDLSGGWFRSDLGLTLTLAGVLVTGLFALQVIKGALRREPGALLRAMTGCGIALVGASDHNGTAIWDAAIAKVILGGGTTARDLADLSALIGDRDDDTITENWDTHGQRSTSRSSRRVPIMDTSQLRTLPFGTGVCLLRAARPTLVDLAARTTSSRGGNVADKRPLPRGDLTV